MLLFLALVRPDLIGNVIAMATDVDPVTVLINSGGLVAGIGVCLWLFVTRKVHTDGEFQDMKDQRDTIAKDYAALQNVVINRALPQTLDANRLALEQLPERAQTTRDEFEAAVAERVASQVKELLGQFKGGGGSG